MVMFDIYKKYIEIDRNSAEQKIYVRAVRILQWNFYWKIWIGRCRLMAHNSAYCLYFLALAFQLYIFTSRLSVSLFRLDDNKVGEIQFTCPTRKYFSFSVVSRVTLVFDANHMLRLYVCAKWITSLKTFTNKCSHLFMYTEQIVFEILLEYLNFFTYSE